MPQLIFRMRFLIIFLSCAFFSFTHCFFIPPKGWDIADPNSLSPRVKMAFLKNTGKGFCPSINLAVEETSATLPEYLKAVRAIHEQDRHNQWRLLGKVKTHAGLAQLTEIDSTTQWGPIRILQLILMKDNHAYVMTAAALKEEFSSFYQAVQTAFRSLSLTPDLLSAVPQLERREMLKQKQKELTQAAQDATLRFSESKKNVWEDSLFQKKHWLPFQKSIVQNFHDMGAFWQVLLLKEVQQKISSFNPVEKKVLDEK